MTTIAERLDRLAVVAKAGPYHPPRLVKCRACSDTGWSYVGDHLVRRCPDGCAPPRRRDATKPAAPQTRREF